MARRWLPLGRFPVQRSPPSPGLGLWWYVIGSVKSMLGLISGTMPGLRFPRSDHGKPRLLSYINIVLRSVVSRRITSGIRRTGQRGELDGYSGRLREHKQYVGITCGVAAWYVAFAHVVNASFSRELVPTWPLT